MCIYIQINFVDTYFQTLLFHILDDSKDCIAPIFGSGFILALLTNLTKSAKYKHCQYFTN